MRFPLCRSTQFELDAVRDEGETTRTVSQLATGLSIIGTLIAAPLLIWLCWNRRRILQHVSPTHPKHKKRSFVNRISSLFRHRRRRSSSSSSSSEPKPSKVEVEMKDLREQLMALRSEQQQKEQQQQQQQVNSQRKGREIEEIVDDPVSSNPSSSDATNLDQSSVLMTETKMVGDGILALNETVHQSPKAKVQQVVPPQCQPAKPKTVVCLPSSTPVDPGQPIKVQAQVHSSPLSSHASDPRFPMSRVSSSDFLRRLQSQDPSSPSFMSPPNPPTPTNITVERGAFATSGVSSITSQDEREFRVWKEEQERRRSAESPGYLAPPSVFSQLPPSTMPDVRFPPPPPSSSPSVHHRSLPAAAGMSGVDSGLGLSAGTESSSSVPPPPPPSSLIRGTSFLGDTSVDFTAITGPTPKQSSSPGPIPSGLRVVMDAVRENFETVRDWRQEVSGEVVLSEANKHSLCENVPPSVQEKIVEQYYLAPIVHAATREDQWMSVVNCLKVLYEAELSYTDVFATDHTKPKRFRTVTRFLQQQQHHQRVSFQQDERVGGGEEN